jgi:hypothetical protein
MSYYKLGQFGGIGGKKQIGAQKTRKYKSTNDFHTLCFVEDTRPRSKDSMVPFLAICNYVAFRYKTTKLFISL